MSEAIIFSDGSSRGNPGRGGWGAIIYFNEKGKDKVVELGDGENMTTNNRMELTAVLESIRFAEDIGKKDIIVHTDSSYVVNSLSKWIWDWEKKDWKTKDGKGVLNRDIFECFFELLPLVKVNFKLIKGHSGINENERCDEIATNFADQKPIELFDGEKGDYRIEFDETKRTPQKNKGRAYSYVSLVDNVIEVHSTWKDCENRVKGKKARFKKSFSKEDEEKIIEDFRK